MTSIDDLSILSTFEVNEIITPSELNKYNDIEDTLLKKVRSKYGNKCNNDGYINKNSIQIISRTMGNIKSIYFTGDIHYKLKLEAKINIPSIGDRIKCQVKGKNSAGILCVKGPFHIILSPNTPENESIYDKIELEDNITIEILRFRVMYRQEHIKVLAKYVE